MPAPDDTGLDEPLVDAETVEDASLRRRFGTRYRGRHAADDAFWWLAHPGALGPSGAASPLQTLQARRGALYRAGAGDDELQAYRRAEAAARADRAAAWEALQESLGPRAERSPRGLGTPVGGGLRAGEPAPRMRVGRRALVLIGAATGVALAAGAGLAAVRGAQRPSLPPTPEPTALTAVRIPAHPADLALPAQREARLLATSFGSMGSAPADAARNALLSVPDASLEVPDALSALDDAGTSENGAPTVQDDAAVRMHPRRFDGGGSLRLHVVTERPASWTWRVVVLNRSTGATRTAFVVVGTKAHGRLQSAAVRMRPEEVPIGVRLTVVPATPYFWDGFYFY